MKILNYERVREMVLMRVARLPVAPQGARDTAPRFAERAAARLRVGNDGNAIVEIALVLPLLMIVMTGIFSFAFAFGNQLLLTQAVGTGAQRLQVIRPTTTDPCADAFTAITSAAPTLNPANINLTITINGGTPQTGNTCKGAVTSLVAAQNLPVTVAATYPCNLSFYGKTFSPTSCLLSAQATEYEY
jgi:Flp pilus assembly protein TadG